jgi:SAM-dependent methyltransferase
MNEIEKYWDNQWKTVIENPEFEEYSQSIPNDFRKHIPKYPILYSTILSVNSIIDLACGTGHLLYTLKLFGCAEKYIGLELSDVIINYANKKYNTDIQKYMDFTTESFIESIEHLIIGCPSIKKGNKYGYWYEKFDILNEKIPIVENSLMVCSNTLEHFKEPFIIIDKILKKCKFFLILVPNEGTSDGGYSGEGSAGHVYTFNADSFSNYEVLDSFTFYSHGWTEGLNEGLNPLQLCVLLKGEL